MLDGGPCRSAQRSAFVAGDSENYSNEENIRTTRLLLPDTLWLFSARTAGLDTPPALRH